MDILMEPEATAELMRRCTRTAIRFPRAQAAEGADTIGIGYAICSQLPPDIYRELVRPLQRELFDAVHAAGALVKLHICGDITDLPVDILDLDHMVDPALARRCVGSRMAIAGRIDPVSEVLRGTPETIRAAVAAGYRNLGNPHLVMAGCEIPSGTPPENLKALCDLVAFQHS